MRLLLVGLAAVGLGACAEPEILFRKPGASPGEFEQTKAHCHNQGLAIAGGNPYASVMGVMVNCMVANGWQRVG